MSSVKFYSANVSGLKNETKRKTVLKNLKKLKSDFILIQETHLNENENLRMAKEWKASAFFSVGGERTRGTAILCANYHNEIFFEHSDANGNFNILATKTKEQKFLIINIYATSGHSKQQQNDRKKIFQKITKILQHLDLNEYLIICGGDFNMVLDEADRYPKLYRKTCGSSQSLKSLLNRFDLEDMWRTFNTDKEEYTYKSTNNVTHSRLDRIYISKSARQYVTTNHVPATFSDHYNAITAKIKLNKIEFGKEIWILNNKHLKNENYQSELKTLLSNQIEQKNSFEKLTDWWETLKNAVKNHARTFSKKEAKCKRKEEYKLRKKLKNAQKKIHNNTNMIILCRELKNKLESFEKNRALGAAIRAKIKWRFQGEKCNKFFLNLEKNKLAKSVITEINTETGETKTHSGDIIAEFENFYNKLYNTEERDLPSQNYLFQNTETKKISKINKENLKKPIELFEIKKAIMQLENNKSPGSDGLTAEFYKTGFPLLGETMTLLYNYILRHGEMTESQKQAVITCLYKKGEKKEINNWRPISLLNTDYKILTKILANRLKHVLPQIISECQTACIPDRTIYDNLSYTRDIIQIAHQNKMNASIISIDQVKAFDRVDRIFLFDSLRYFGFGITFTNFIKTLYYDISARVKINGFLSKTIKIIRGVRQGCPLSMMLYNIQAEIFAGYIRKNPKIKGITINKNETKILQYADDTNFYLTGDDSITELGHALDINYKATGTKLNRDKCQGLWLGSNITQDKEKYLGFEWADNCFKSLGVLFSNNNDYNTNKQWREEVDKVREKILKWTRVKLSLKGKALIINQSLLSGLWHLAFTLPLPCPKLINTLENTIQNYLWDNKNIKTNKNISKLPIEKGGLKIVNIKEKLKSIQASWVPKLFNSEQTGPWRDTAEQILNKYRNAEQGNLVFLTAHSDAKLKTIPLYYRQMITDWTEMTKNRARKHLTIEQILRQPIFHNPHIRKSNKTLTPTTNAKRNGLIKLADIANVFRPGFLDNKLINLTEKELNDIIASLPPDWKHKIENESQNYDHNKANLTITGTKNTEINIPDLKPKIIYKILMEKQTVKTKTHFIKWNKIFKNSMLNTTDMEWEKLFTKIHKSRNNNKASEIKYKAIHFALPTNSIFKKRGYANDDLCPQCMKECETLPHMLFNCEKVQPLIKYAVSFLNILYPKREPFENTFKLFLFGPSDNAQEYCFGNYIFDELFYHIYCNRMRAYHERTTHTKVSLLREFEGKLKNIINTEYQIAKETNSLNDFLNETKNLWNDENKLEIKLKLNTFLR